MYVTTHVTFEDAGYDFPRTFADVSLREIVRKMRYLSPIVEIWTKRQYCNRLFITISYLLENVTGSWLGGDPPYQD